MSPTNDSITTTIGPKSQRYLLGFDLRRKPHLEADVLVIGAGVAGMVAALAAADAGSEVLLIAKGPLLESNTRYAQGGVAAVLAETEREDGDSLEKHVQDTLNAGGNCCDEQMVRSILEDGAEAIDFLRNFGCVFDKNTDGSVALTREGGHQARRILHAQGDKTGAEVARALCEAVESHDMITVRDHTFALDLLTDDGVVCGALYERKGEIYGALAGCTILATGGIGRCWRETSNPVIATGDGLAMAYRAGATVADMEFMQFHPTTLYIAGGARLLITEAMRGEGAILKNHAGEAFMPRYHELSDLAPRDVVSQAIVSEIQESAFPHVWLDATHLGDTFLRERFPAIHRVCANFDIDIAKDWIPVHPSAHYHCGGVLTDEYGRTNLPKLLAAGEVACTRLHGANRLASNSILEGLVMGLRAGRLAHTEGGFPGRVRLSHPHYKPVSEDLDSADLIRSLRALMWRYAGITRSESELATAARSLEFWSKHQARGAFDHTTGYELQNLLLVSSLVVAGARGRTASAGTHLRLDSDGNHASAPLAFVREKNTP